MLLSESANVLLQQAGQAYRDTGSLPDDLLMALGVIFQGPLLPALDLIDNKKVTLVTCPKGRSLYQVMGSTGVPYICFLHCNYCTCPAFKFSVLKKEDHLLCKHLLAVKLSQAMGVVTELQVSDREIADMIRAME